MTSISTPVTAPGPTFAPPVVTPATPAALAASPVMPQAELFRRTISLLTIGLLVVGSFLVLFAFLPAMVWAATIVVSTWPLLLRLEKRFDGRRGPAVAVMTGSIIVLIIIPVLAMVLVIADHTDDVTRITQALAASGLPDAPAWTAKIPVVGRKLQDRWAALAALPPDALREQLAPQARIATAWLVDKLGNVLGVIAQLLLTATVCGIFYKSGEHIAERTLAFARRLGGRDGEQVAVLASRAVRGVATGVIVTAVIQTILTGIALSLAGVPGVGLLCAIAFLFCLAQLGPTLVLLAATGWIYWSGHTTTAIVMFVASLAIGALDNVLRPILIKKGADLPLLLVFAGVIGGIFSFGILGVFVGPVLLAVTKTLFDVWIAPAETLSAETRSAEALSAEALPAA